MPRGAEAPRPSAQWPVAWQAWRRAGGRRGAYIPSLSSSQPLHHSSPPCPCSSVPPPSAPPPAPTRARSCRPVTPTSRTSSTSACPRERASDAATSPVPQGGRTSRKINKRHGRHSSVRRRSADTRSTIPGDTRKKVPMALKLITYTVCGFGLPFVSTSDAGGAFALCLG